MSEPAASPAQEPSAPSQPPAAETPNPEPAPPAPPEEPAPLTPRQLKGIMTTAAEAALLPGGVMRAPAGLKLAPGTLVNAEGELLPPPKPGEDYLPKPLSHKRARRLGNKYGLRKLGARPRLGVYVRSLWQRRHFIWALASSDAYGRNQGSYLGQLWAALNPLLNFGVSWLVFGYILQTTRGKFDFISYLAVGTFMFSFQASGLNQCARVMNSRVGLIRALEFPRAVLPISSSVAELIMEWPAMLVMLIIVVVEGLIGKAPGQYPSWSWFGLIPVTAMMYVWTLGLGFILARICSKTPDLANLVPVFTSLLRFVAGVMYSLHTMMPAHVPHAIREILFNEPWALMLSLARACCVKHCSAQPWEWGLGAAYAIVIVVIGFIYFWRDEARYGRD